MAVAARGVGSRLNRSNRTCAARCAYVGGLGLTLCLATFSGCEQPMAEAPAAVEEVGGQQPVAVEPRPLPTVPTGFGPAKITILPLTELVTAASGQGAGLDVYVAVLDAFGSQIKAPTTVRIELYEHTPRSAQAKGQRIAIWPDIDLAHPAENNKYWRDLLRAYQFEFDVQADREKTYILEVTCLCPDGRRLSAEQAIRVGP